MKNGLLVLIFGVLLSVPSFADILSVIDLGAHFRPTAVNINGVVAGLVPSPLFLTRRHRHLHPKIAA